MYTKPVEAVREVERDLFEMGIDVHPQTMQDKWVGDDPEYKTKEVRAYGFQLVGWQWNLADEAEMVNYVLTGRTGGSPHPTLPSVMEYIEKEFRDRTCGVSSNPGESFKARQQVWGEFLHDGKFHYTYSERIAPQLETVRRELDIHPDTRQAIINIHTNICPVIPEGPKVQENLKGCTTAWPSRDMKAMGASGRVPCSMYYQAMYRDGKIDLIYAMRSCDFLTHFPVDIALALRMQNFLAKGCGREGVPMGMFTYFTGSLHAYKKDLKTRGIF